MKNEHVKPGSISIIVPALNEEESLSFVTQGIIRACENKLELELILIDDGSSDSTGKIAEELKESNENVKVIHHTMSKGIGASFREGVEISTKDIVTWLPADGENDVVELLKYIGLFRYVDVVIPFVINTGMRNWHRRILSSLYLFIINFSFGTTFNYTNGNIMYRREVFNKLKNRSNGFFCHTECLVKALRMGLVFAEVPVFLNNRQASNSKAISWKNFFQVSMDYMYLFVAVHFLRRTGKTN